MALQDRLYCSHDAGFPIDQSAIAIERQVGEVFELDQSGASL